MRRSIHWERLLWLALTVSLVLLVLPQANFVWLSFHADLGLGNFVRLSFCEKNPMMFVSKKEGRISNPVTLRVKLEAVSRPGVLFSDCNATRRDANLSESPDIVRFEIVKATSCFAVPELLRHFFQAEVLVPSPLPPHLIVFPSRKEQERIE